MIGPQSVSPSSPDGTPTRVRSLDGVQPPEQWGDITARAAGPEPVPVLATGPRRSRRPLVLVAVLVLLAGVAGALALAQRGGHTDLATRAGSDPPADMVGPTWNLSGLARDGKDQSLPTGAPPTFEVTAKGEVRFQACNQGGGSGGIQGDRLVVGNEWFQTAAACMGDEGEARMALDETMQRFLQADPSIELSGDRLTLRSGDTEAVFVDVDPGGRGIAVAKIASGDADCVLGLREEERDGTVGNWVLTPGPAEPELVEGWDSGLRPTGAVPGAWHLREGDQTVELHVPGLTVIDLVGERTETVPVEGRGRATLWFTDRWVQLRSFPEVQRGCDSFDVTVAGPDEAANRDLAVRLAPLVVTGERDRQAEAALAEEIGAAFWGHRWEIVGGGSDGPIGDLAVTRVDGQAPVVDVTAEGSFSIAGCNGVAGTAVLAGDRLDVTLGPSTRRACAADLLAQEAWLRTFLDRDPRVVVDGGGRITLIGDDAALSLAPV